MGHQDKGHYAKKHPGQTPDPGCQETLQAAAKQGILTCADAHRAAKTLGGAPGQIGIQADLLELRISQCQLGLFGYSPGKKNLDPDVRVSPELGEAILAAQQDGRISCKVCWEMAKTHNISRLDMGAACEKKEIRIKPCQLGAF
ncbi:MAG: hypothetical protein V6Z89_21475 [Desulfobacter sp.]